MPDAATIREFLVGFGFKIDEGSQRRFSEGVKTAGSGAAGLQAAINQVTTALQQLGKAFDQTTNQPVKKYGEALSRITLLQEKWHKQTIEFWRIAWPTMTGAVAGLGRVIEGTSGRLEGLYLTGRMAGSSVAGLQQLDLALQQIGAGADRGKTLITNMSLAAKRMGPGVEGFFGAITKQRWDPDAKAMPQNLLRLLDAFSREPAWLRAGQAEQWGIPQQTLESIVGTKEAYADFQEEMKKAAELPAGDEAAKKSHKFMEAWRDAWAAFSRAGDNAIGDIEGYLTPLIEKARQFIVDLEKEHPNVAAGLKFGAVAGAGAGAAALGWAGLRGLAKIMRGAPVAAGGEAAAGAAAAAGGEAAAGAAGAAGTGELIAGGALGGAGLGLGAGVLGAGTLGAGGVAGYELQKHTGIGRVLDKILDWWDQPIISGAAEAAVPYSPQTQQRIDAGAAKPAPPAAKPSPPAAKPAPPAAKPAPPPPAAKPPYEPVIVEDQQDIDDLEPGTWYNFKGKIDQKGSGGPPKFGVVPGRSGAPEPDLTLPEVSVHPGDRPHFQRGGIVPISAHPGEMVLPEPISRGVQTVFGEGGAGHKAWEQMSAWLQGFGAIAPKVKIDNVDQLADAHAEAQRQAFPGGVAGTPTAAGAPWNFESRLPAPGGVAGTPGEPVPAGAPWNFETAGGRFRTPAAQRTADWWQRTFPFSRQLGAGGGVAAGALEEWQARMRNADIGLPVHSAAEAAARAAQGPWWQRTFPFSRQLGQAFGAAAAPVQRGFQAAAGAAERVAAPIGKLGAAFAQKAATIMPRLMKDLGLSKDQAAGLLGNLGYESGGLSVYHERGLPEAQGGVGWAQWTGPRRRAFEAWTKEHNLDPHSDAASYAFLVHELQTSQSGFLKKLRGTRDLASATRTTYGDFEAPRDYQTGEFTSWRGRLGKAQQAAAAIPTAQHGALIPHVPGGRMLLAAHSGELVLPQALSRGLARLVESLPLGRDFLDRLGGRPLGNQFYSGGNNMSRTVQMHVTHNLTVQGGGPGDVGRYSSAATRLYGDLLRNLKGGVLA